MRKIADALQHAHEQGVVHRDLKPANIMIDGEGQPHLMDFGLARREVGEVTVTLDGQILGTPAYMSPEQAEGEAHTADRRSDVYSLGVILFQLLTGELPFRGNARMIMHQVVHDEPPSPRKLNSNVPRDLETITLKCLEKDAARRYPSALELAADLRRFLSSQSILARPTSRGDRMMKWVRRNRTIAALSSAIAMALITGTLVSTYFAIDARRQAAIANLRQHEADTSRQEALAARNAAEKNLYAARLNEVRAIRKSQVPGWSDTAFKNLRDNLELEIPEVDVIDLRNEAIACLELPDVQEVGELSGHSAPIWSVDSTGDGRFLASAGYDGQLIIWNVNDQTEIRRIVDEQYTPQSTYNAASPYPNVRFSPDGRRVAYITWNRQVRIEPVEGSAGNRIDIIAPASSPDAFPLAQAHSLAFDGSGERVAVAWSDGQIAVYDTNVGRLVWKAMTSRRPEITPTPIAISPDGTLVAATDGYNRVNLYHVRKDAAPLSVGRHLDLVTSLAFNSDGLLLASASHDRTAAIFDLRSGERLAILVGHKDRVKCVVFSPDGQWVLTTSDDTAARIWNPYTAEPIMVLTPRIGALLSATFAKNESMFSVAGGDGKVTLYRLSNSPAMRQLWGHTYSVRGSAFDTEGASLASGGEDSRIVVWDVQTGRPVRQWAAHPSKFVKDVAFSPKGLLASIFVSAFNVRQTPVAISLWNPSTGDLVCRLHGHQCDVVSLSFDELGDLLATTDSLGNISIWRVGQAKPLTVLRQQGILGAAFCAPDPHLLTTSKQGTLTIYDPVSGDVLRRRELSLPVSSFAVAPTKDRFALGTLTGQIRIFDSSTLDALTTIDLEAQEAIVAISFAPDGHVLAAGTDQGRASIWNSRTGRRLASLPSARQAAIYKLQFHPQQEYLAVLYAREQAVTLWSLSRVDACLRENGLAPEIRLIPTKRPIDPLSVSPSFVVAAQSAELQVQGNGTPFTVRSVTGHVNFTPESGVTPATVKVQSAVGGNQWFSIEIERTDFSSVRRVGGVFTGFDWDIAFYRFECPGAKRPPKDWDGVIGGTPLATTRAANLMQLVSADQRSHFACVATTEFESRKGTYEIMVDPQEPVRVFLDDKVVLDTWIADSGSQVNKLSGDAPADNSSQADETTDAETVTRVSVADGTHRWKMETYSHGRIVNPGLIIRRFESE